MPHAVPAARDIDLRFPGRIGFAEAVVLQQRAAEALKAGAGVGTVFVLEHPPVITLGANKKLNKVLAAPPGVPVIQTPRGGGATAHEPGQLHVVPVEPLRPPGLGARGARPAGPSPFGGLGAPAERFPEPGASPRAVVREAGPP